MDRRDGVDGPKVHEPTYIILWSKIYIEIHNEREGIGAGNAGSCASCEVFARSSVHRIVVRPKFVVLKRLQFLVPDADNGYSRVWYDCE